MAGTKTLTNAGWLRTYPKAWLRYDIVAGLTAAAVVIPKAMACAVIAGLPVESGLYTGLAAMLVYPLLGTSRSLSVSTTTTIAMMTAAEVAVIAKTGPEVAAGAVGVTLALLVGGIMILARLLRLGYIANFISTPVLTGFQAGIGVAIVVSQLKSVLGVHLTSHATLGVLAELPRTLHAVHLPTVFVGLAGIGLLLALERLFPKSPAPLVLVVLSIIAAGLFHLEALGVKLVGTVPSGLPAPQLPNFSLVGKLWPAALGIALMSLTESIAAARSFARHGDRRIDPNRELLAVGAANVAAAFFGGFPAGGGTSQTAVNDKAGARSQMAQITTAGVVVVSLLFLSRVIGLLPQASLGALVIVVSASMIKPAKFRAIRRIRLEEFIWALVAMIGVIVIGTLEGVLVAVGISILTLFYHANHPPVYEVAYNQEKRIFRQLGENADDVTFPGLLLLRTEGRLHFASAPRVSDQMRALVDKINPEVVVLEMSAVPDIEYSALMMLSEAVDNQRARGVEVWLAALNPDILKVVGRSPLEGKLGRERMFFNLHKAVEAYRARAERSGPKKEA